MIRPRWQGLSRSPRWSSWRRWDQAIALLAATNLAWVMFDVSYIPLRNFWLQRNLYPLPTLPLVVPLQLLPDITPFYDRIKGIEPHRDTQRYLEQFKVLDQTLSTDAPSPARVKPLLERQHQLTLRLLEANPFLSSGNTGALEKIKNRLRAHAGLESARQSATLLLNPDHIKGLDWTQERQFWTRQILPLVEINYWRSLDDSGQLTDLSWRIDTPFQLLFLLDILLRALRLKRRYPAIRWRDALLRRWIDLPLLIPFWRVLRIVPVTERCSVSGLIQLEPLRAVISRGVVALLALELFEVITIRVVDALQQVIRSPQLPQRIRGFCTYQTTDQNDQRELLELLRLWVPLLLTRVGPSLRPQLVALLSHVLQQSMNSRIKPDSLQRLPGLQKAESELSRQLATGVIDSLLDLSKTTGNRLGQRDQTLDQLGTDALDRFWEELARVLDDGPVLDRSQTLLASFLEDLKRSSFRQLRDQGGVDALINELDGLNFSSSAGPAKPQA